MTKYEITFRDSNAVLRLPNEEFTGVVLGRPDGLALSQSIPRWTLIPWHRVFQVETINE